jgi:hypothetical protein
MVAGLAIDGPVSECPFKSGLMSSPGTGCGPVAQAHGPLLQQASDADRVCTTVASRKRQNIRSPVRGIRNVELFPGGLSHPPSIVVCDLIAMMLQLCSPLCWIVYQGLKLRPSEIDTLPNSIGKVTVPGDVRILSKPSRAAARLRKRSDTYICPAYLVAMARPKGDRYLSAILIHRSTYPTHRHPPSTGRQPDARAAACGAGSPSVTPSMMDSILHDMHREQRGLQARKAHGFSDHSPHGLADMT